MVGSSLTSLKGTRNKKDSTATLTSSSSREAMCKVGENIGGLQGIPINIVLEQHATLSKAKSSKSKTIATSKTNTNDKRKTKSVSLIPTSVNLHVKQSVNSPSNISATSSMSSIHLASKKSTNHQSACKYSDKISDNQTQPDCRQRQGKYDFSTTVTIKSDKKKINSGSEREGER